MRSHSSLRYVRKLARVALLPLLGALGPFAVAAADAPPAPHAPSAQVRDDVKLCLGRGRNEPAAREARARALRAPALYLDAIAALYLHDTTHLGTTPPGALPTLLGELYPRAPEDTARLAGRLARAATDLLAREPLDPARSATLHADVEGLEVLGGGIDRPLPAGGPPHAVDAAKVVEIPGPPPTHLGLEVTETCTCGEPRACAIRLLPGAAHVLEIDLRQVPGRVGVCTDCYPTSTTCSLPPLARGTAYEVVAHGAWIGRLAADARAGEPVRRDLTSKPATRGSVPPSTSHDASKRGL